MDTHTTVRVRGYCTPAGYVQLDDVMRDQRRLYNAALEHRKTAYRTAGVSITLYDQLKELTQVRADDPAHGDVDVRLGRQTLKRLAHAFNAFFRRVRNHETPGFPRFKGYNRFRTVSTEGGRLRRYKNGAARLLIKGLPSIRITAKDASRFPDGKYVMARVTRRGRRVFVALTFAASFEPLPATSAAVGIDAEREKAACHAETTAIVRRYGLVVMEDLNIRNMTKSARGTMDEPGKNVVAKSGLNREILEQRWGMFRHQITYKAERAGRILELVPAPYTSQTCSRCGMVDASARRGDCYDCPACGLPVHADTNAAINILRLGITQAGMGDPARRAAGSVPTDGLPSVRAEIPYSTE